MRFAYNTGMTTTDTTRRLLTRILVAAIFAASFSVLVWRSFYTFCWIDESFYISLADQLFKGAAPFIDEWHPAQAYAPLLLPFYSAFVSVSGSTDGIVLYFRLLYVCVSFAASLFAYFSLKGKFGRFIACCIALTYLFYVRGNILGMSYYSLCTTFFFLGLLLAWRAYEFTMNTFDFGEPSAPRVLLPLASGAAFALAILCNPVVIVFAFCACLTGLARAVIRRQAKGFTPFAWAMAGAAVVICTYLLFITSRTDIQAVVGNLPNIFSSHDENLTLSQRIPNYLSYLPVSRAGFVGTWALVIFLIFWRVTGRSISLRFRGIVLGLDAICLALAVYAAFATSIYPNKVFLAFAEFAMPCYLLQEDLNFSLDAHPELHLFWIPGVLLSVIWEFSSNTQVSGMLIGFMFACFGAFITVRNAVPAPREILPDSASLSAPPWMRACCLALIALVALSTACIRVANVYSDADWPDLTVTIQDGPAQGLVTSEQHAREYEGVMSLVSKVNTDGPVWIAPMAPWGYLLVRGECGAVSTWNTFMDEHDAEVYYGELGHELPQWIVVTEDDLGKSVNVIAGRVKEFPALEMYHEHNAKLRDWLDASADYGPIYETEFGTVYKRAEHSEITEWRAAGS